MKDVFLAKPPSSTGGDVSPQGPDAWGGCSFADLTDRLIAAAEASGSRAEYLVAALTAEGMDEEHALAAFIGSTAATFAPSDQATTSFLADWALYVDGRLVASHGDRSEHAGRDDDSHGGPTTMQLRGMRLGIANALNDEARFSKQRHGRCI